MSCHTQSVPTVSAPRTLITGSRTLICSWHPCAGKVVAGSVQKAVIVETRKELQRRDGSVVRFHKNACVLVNQKGQPIGTRVLGFATHELRSRGMLKILSLAARVL